MGAVQIQGRAPLQGLAAVGARHLDSDNLDHESRQPLGWEAIVAMHWSEHGIGIRIAWRTRWTARPWAAFGAPHHQHARIFDAVDHFSGGWAYETNYFKAKSDYVVNGLSDNGIEALLRALKGAPAGQIVALCDAYGGAIANVASSASAFPHRDQQTFCIQYYSSWTRAADITQRLANMSKVYAAMRPHVPGACYVNYCDLDLPDWATSYWGANLSRLRQIKSQYDPNNSFRHAQSVQPI